jgi:hypothetical protein
LWWPRCRRSCLCGRPQRAYRTWACWMPTSEPASLYLLCHTVRVGCPRRSRHHYTYSAAQYLCCASTCRITMLA